MEPATNMQKYENYKGQMTRLKKALGAKFYLEAIFIEQNILEDRVESILRHSNKYNPKKHNKLDNKLSKLEEMQREKNGLVRKYISDELICKMYGWKKSRNDAVHALVKYNFSTADLSEIAERGHNIVKELNNKVSCYNRRIDRDNAKKEMPHV